MKSKNELIQLKIAVVGNPSAGKTSFIRHLINPQYQKETFPTQEYEVYLHCLSTKTIDFQIQFWDCSGQYLSFHKYLRQAFFRNSSAALLIFDISKKNWKEQAENWITEIYEKQCYLVHAIATHIDIVMGRALRKAALEESLLSNYDKKFKEETVEFFSKYDIKVHFQSVKQELEPSIQNLLLNIHNQSQSISQSVAKGLLLSKNTPEQLINGTLSVFYDSEND